MNPNNLSVVSTFCTIATLSSIGFGWLVNQGKLPIQPAINYSDRQLQFIQLWIKLALLLGIIVPGVLLAAGWSNSDLRQMLVVYLLVVAIQLVSERILSRWLCSSVVVEIGIIYTTYRLWHLSSGLDLLDNLVLLGLFWSVLLFWIANLIMLLTLPGPTILLRSEGTQQE